ncbi:MAG: hypothetical protein OHK0039_18750 [Bacteroidia bacterium]
MKSILITTCVLLLMLPLAAQDADKRPGATLGLQLTEVGQHYGIGLNAATPLIWQNRLALRLTGTMHYYELNGTLEKPLDWYPFAQFRLGVVNYASVCACGVRVYGETGPVAVLPGKAFSNGAWQFGWFGLFGAEFLMSDHALFFFEMGGQGVSNESAEIPLGNSTFGNGFIVAAGFRFQF